MYRLFALPAAMRGNRDAYAIKQAIHQGNAHLAIALAMPTHGRESLGDILSLGNAHRHSDGLQIAGIGTEHTYTPPLINSCLKYRGNIGKLQTIVSCAIPCYTRARSSGSFARVWRCTRGLRA